MVGGVNVLVGINVAEVVGVIDGIDEVGGNAAEVVGDCVTVGEVGCVVGGVVVGDVVGVVVVGDVVGALDVVAVGVVDGDVEPPAPAVVGWGVR